ncbi:MAG TPA: aminotransferase class V-fold PLP-dependent enzyme [Ktedonobacterales bacterium]
MKTLERLQAAQAAFIAKTPAYEGTRALDDLRAREYRRLDEQGHIYLDYTGGGLYADSQLREHMALLSRGVFGNPHSGNPTSQAATQLDEHAREFVLDYFNASRDEYCVVFTQNASGALKLVGEAYPFAPGGHYLMTFDNHNSVNGIREYARAKGATVTYSPVVPPDLRLDEDRLRAAFELAQPGHASLFAYPSQSNYSGVRHSMDWIAEAQAKGWDVLLDCAAFAATNRLDLGEIHPDFVPLSFYKMFGYPTGVGCLIARKTALAKLRRPWFAGGTVTMASVQGDGFYLDEGEIAFEDGTIDYLNLPAVEIGLRFLRSVGLDLVHDRVNYLTGWLLDSMTRLRHRSGMPLVRIYGPITTEDRGGTIAFNFFDPDGKVFAHRVIEDAAATRNISLRGGFFCNPGAGENALGLTKAELEDCFHREERMSFDQFMMSLRQKDVKTVGAVRLSLGIATNFADVYHFVEFAETFLDQPAAEM